MTHREQFRFINAQVAMMRLVEKLMELPLDEFVAQMDRLEATGEIADGSSVGNAVALFPESMREIARILSDARAAMAAPLARAGKVGTLNLEALVE